MSIIYDALKKVQKTTGQEEAPFTTYPSNIAPQTPKPVHAKTKIKPVLIYLLVVSFGLASGNFAFNFFTHPKNVSSAKNETISQSNTPSIPPPPKQEPQAAVVNTDISASPSIKIPEPTLVLTGVFFEQGEGCALINNKIVRIGDEVSHAKVKEITMGGVTLEFEGKTIRLNNPS